MNVRYTASIDSSLALQVLDGFVDDGAAVGNQAALDDVVLLVEDKGFIFRVPVLAQHVEQVGRIHLAGVTAYVIGPVALADDGDAVDEDFLSGHRAFHVAAGFRSHVDDHAAGLHGFHHVTGHQDRRLAPEYLGGGDDDIGFGNRRLLTLALYFNLFRGQFPGIAVLGLARFTQVNLKELCTDRAHLLGDDGAGIEGRHLGAQPFGRGDGLQSGDPGADDEYPWPV